MKKKCLIISWAVIMGSLPIQTIRSSQSCVSTGRTTISVEYEDHSVEQNISLKQSIVDSLQLDFKGTLQEHHIIVMRLWRKYLECTGSITEFDRLDKPLYDSYIKRLQDAILKYFKSNGTAKTEKGYWDCRDDWSAYWRGTIYSVSGIKGKCEEVTFYYGNGTVAEKRVDQMGYKRDEFSYVPLPFALDNPYEFIDLYHDYLLCSYFPSHRSSYFYYDLEVKLEDDNFKALVLRAEKEGAKKVATNGNFVDTKLQAWLEAGIWYRKMEKAQAANTSFAYKVIKVSDCFYQLSKVMFLNKLTHVEPIRTGLFGVNKGPFQY